MNDYEIVQIDGKPYHQYYKDSKGRSPNLPIGTHVRVQGEKGTILLQILHTDQFETFFGNVFVLLASGEYMHCNGWMCKKVDV